MNWMDWNAGATVRDIGNLLFGIFIGALLMVSILGIVGALR